MYMTMEKIHEKYDWQWIFMINCTENANGTVTGGEVVLHSENRDNVIRKMEKYDYELSMTYFRYARRILEGISTILL